MSIFIYFTLLIMMLKPLFSENEFSKYFDVILEGINATLYLDDKYNIFPIEDSGCLEDVVDVLYNYSKFEKKYPKLIISNGKGVDDIGNEIECNGTNLFAEYLLLYIETSNKVIKTDDGLSDYLNRSYLYFGFCIPTSCSNITNDLLTKMNLTNISIFNQYNDLKIIIYNRKKVDENVKLTPDIIFWFFIGCLIIKLLSGIIIKFKYPKGYEIHGILLYNQKRESEKNSIITDENEEDFLKNKDNDKIDDNKLEDINIKGRYNPEFDYETLYPMYFRFIKFLDLFNNIKIYIQKRNRYFNENDIDLLSSIKAIILGYHILTLTIQVLIRLPNTSVFNTEYYKSFQLFAYKRSINSFTFWIILESATFSFKLMKFIQKKINKEENVNKRRQFKIVVNQTFKFFCFYIPKIISYIFIFIVFYYLFEDYTCGFEAKMTYYYISKEIVNKKECIQLEKLWYAFIPFVNYKYNLYGSSNKNQTEKFKNIFQICFSFSYLYSNMFFSSLFFIVILFILFYFQKKAIDIIISLFAIFGTIISYIYYFFNSDSIFENDQNKYKFYHFSGENYSIFYPHVFFGYYYLGCLIGFCLYYYNEQKNKNKENKSNRRKSNSKLNEESQKKNGTVELYKPMEFCYSFIKSLKDTKNYVKIIFLFIYIILCSIISNITYIIFLIRKKDEENEIFTIYIKEYKILQILYFFEKIINSILFSFLICILSVLPKNYTIIKIMSSSFFTPISRAGFFATCSYEFLIYMLYCLFQLKVKIGFLVICYIMIGFYTIIVIFCIYASILIEFPFRIIIKNLLKDDSPTKQNLQIILMKQI